MFHKWIDDFEKRKDDIFFEGSQANEIFNYSESDNVQITTEEILWHCKNDTDALYYFQAKLNFLNKEKRGVYITITLDQRKSFEDLYIKHVVKSKKTMSDFADFNILSTDVAKIMEENEKIKKEISNEQLLEK